APGPRHNGGKIIIGPDNNLYVTVGDIDGSFKEQDTVSGKLWESENGPEDGDEINLVEQGFNSGWQQVHGLAKSTKGFKTSDLVDFDGKGHYRDPELVWQNTTGPTAILFYEFK